MVGTITVIGCLLAIILALGITVTVAFRKVETVLNDVKKQIAQTERTFKESTDFLSIQIGRTMNAMSENNKRTNQWIKQLNADIKQNKADTADCMRIHALRKDYENGE